MWEVRQKSWQPPGRSVWPMASRPPPRRRASATTAARPASAAASPASRVLAAVCSPPAYPIATALAATLDISDADSAARALLTAAGAEPHLFGVLRALIAHEFTAHAAHPAQIGRAHSLVSRALGQHARRVGGPYLREVLGPLVGELAAAPRALEVDPARMPDDHAAGELTDNVAALADWLGRCTDALTSARSLAALPTQMRAVLAEMGRHADAAQMERGLRTALFGGYLILRFVNPAIVAPESHGLLATPPSLPARTSLKYAAKLLQAAANGSLPPEEAFVPLHETIRAAQPRIAAFLVTCADEPAASMLTRTTTRTDGGCEAASDEAASGEAASGEAATGVWRMCRKRRADRRRASTGQPILSRPDGPSPGKRSNLRRSTGTPGWRGPPMRAPTPSPCGATATVREGSERVDGLTVRAEDQVSTTACEDAYWVSRSRDARIRRSVDGCLARAPDYCMSYLCAATCDAASTRR